MVECAIAISAQDAVSGKPASMSASRHCPSRFVEPHRVSRRLHSLRGWGHGETEPVNHPEPDLRFGRGYLEALRDELAFMPRNLFLILRLMNSGSTREATDRATEAAREPAAWAA